MNFMKRLEKVMIVITMILMVNIVAYAQQGNGHNQRHDSNLKQGLNLSEDQLSKMKTIRLDLQKELLPIKNKLGENKARYRTLTTAENADMKAINKLIDDNSQLTASMAKLKAANHQTVRQLLTEDQRILFDSRDMRRVKKHGQQGRRAERGKKRHKQPAQGHGGTQQGKN